MSRERSRRGVLVSGAAALAAGSLLTGVSAGDDRPAVSGRRGVTQPSGWDRRYSDGRVSGVRSIAAVDGDFVALGTTAEVRYVPATNQLFRVDGATGEREWTRTVETAEYAALSVLTPVGDGGYLLAGDPGDGREQDPRASLVRLDAGGETVWERVYDLSDPEHSGEGSAPASDRSASDPDAATPAGDGPSVLVRDAAVDGDGYVLLAHYSSPPDAVGPVLLKADGDGTERWRRWLFPDSPIFPQAITTVDDGYVLSGFRRQTFVGSGNVRVGVLARVDASGETRWRRTYAAPIEEASAMHATANDHAAFEDGYALVGFTSAHRGRRARGWIVRTDAEGRQESARVFRSERELRLRNVASYDGRLYASGYAAATADRWPTAIVAGMDPADDSAWRAPLTGRLDAQSVDVAITGDGTVGVAARVDSEADDVVASGWISAFADGDAPAPIATDGPPTTGANSTGTTAETDADRAGTTAGDPGATTEANGPGFGVAALVAALGGYCWSQFDGDGGT